MNFNDINRHERDGLIDFEESTHTYSMGGRVFDSVTTVVERCFEQFDAAYWAERKATPAKPVAALIAEWEAKGRAARDLGTLMHSRIEHFYLGQPDPDDEVASDPTYARFLDFAAARRLYPFRTEWRIFDEDYALAGTLDFLERDPDGNFEIWDWKRSSKLIDRFTGAVVDYNRYGKTGFFPVASLPDTSYHHYALQVSIYRYILRHKYGIDVRAGHLGVFHPDYSTYYIIDLPYLEDEVKALLDSRIR